jgi:hypothetical protein
MLHIVVVSVPGFLYFLIFGLPVRLTSESDIYGPFVDKMKLWCACCRRRQQQHQQQQQQQRGAYESEESALFHSGANTATATTAASSRGTNPAMYGGLPASFDNRDDSYYTGL